MHRYGTGTILIVAICIGTGTILIGAVYFSTIFCIFCGTFCTENYITPHQCFGSGFRLDPDSGGLLDPDPGAYIKKGKNCQIITT